MAVTYWRKQGVEPLFPDLLWSRPENRQHSGKLLIIGGNLHGFAAPATAYQEALTAGIGVSKVLLPNALQKTVGRILENGEYAPSTPSGSFNQQALATWMEWSQWADGILLAGDLGRNSETAITIENFVSKTTNPIVITKDAIDYFYANPNAILQHSKTTLVLSLAQLQKLSKEAKTEHPVTFGMGLPQLVEWLHNFSNKHKARIMVYHLGNILVAVQGQVTSTSVGEKNTWRVKTAAHAAVWWLQNPSKPLEALTTSLV
ncbi:MAG: hypothetical protein WCJ24_02930 [Candidatus Saccharibacteria bacterium]